MVLRLFLSHNVFTGFSSRSCTGYSSRILLCLVHNSTNANTSNILYKHFNNILQRKYFINKFVIFHSYFHRTHVTVNKCIVCDTGDQNIFLRFGVTTTFNNEAHITAWHGWITHVIAPRNTTNYVVPTTYYTHRIIQSICCMGQIFSITACRPLKTRA